MSAYWFWKALDLMLHTGPWCYVQVSEPVGRVVYGGNCVQAWLLSVFHPGWSWYIG